METSKMKLIPVPIKYSFGRYDIDIDLKYDIDNDLSIKAVGVNAQGNECKVKIDFSSFAEINLFHFNFWEQNDGDILTKTPYDGYVDDKFDIADKYREYWLKNEICIDSGFYMVENTHWYEKRDIYLELKERGYCHYLLTGYDTYIELLAKNDMQISEIVNYGKR